MYIEDDENGSGIALRILDWSTIGFPFLLPDLAALRALVVSEASLWKKCPGSVERDILSCWYVLCENVRRSDTTQAWYAARSGGGRACAKIQGCQHFR